MHLEEKRGVDGRKDSVCASNVHENQLRPEANDPVQSVELVAGEEASSV